jgi:ABC-type polysaccharide/polyol phosphate transport system ATPase subunit
MPPSSQPLTEQPLEPGPATVRAQRTDRPVVIEVRNVNKTFRIPEHRVDSFKERAVHPLRRIQYRTLQALQDVSFEVHQGEFFGIVGRNGSGKSTLLKIMASIYRADAGRVRMAGRVAPFIELGVGMNPELTAWENGILNGVLMGLTRREAQRRLQAVIEFAELEEFADLRLKNYSSGMLIRFAFAVMVQADADVMLIDEVLAVGDAAFQQKCFDEFARIRESGRTVLLVTHDMGAVNRFCDRALLLERGRVAAHGDPETVGNRYFELNFSEAARADAGLDRSTERMGDGHAEIVECWFEDGAGAAVAGVAAGAPCAFAARVRFIEPVDDPLFGVVVQNDRRETVLAASTLWSDPTPGRYEPGDEVTYRVRFENRLVPGRYFATPAVARQGQGIAWIDRRERMADLLVSGLTRTDAVVDLPYEVTVSRAARAEVPAS